MTHEIDEQLIRDVCRRIGTGAFPKQALASCGVPLHIAGLWLDHGRRALESHTGSDEELTARLVAAIDVAEADLAQRWVGEIISASHKGAAWQRFDALLEKRFPEVYAKRSVSHGKGVDKRSLEDILDDINAQKPAEADADA